MKNKEKDDTLKFAPGLDDEEELEQNASQEEIQKGEYTPVITLAYDEVDPS